MPWLDLELSQGSLFLSLFLQKFHKPPDFLFLLFQDIDSFDLDFFSFPSKLLPCLFEADKVVVEEVNIALLVLEGKKFQHFPGGVGGSPVERSQRLKSALFSYHIRKSKVNEDWLIFARAPHYVLGVDVQVDHSEPVHVSQVGQNSLEVLLLNFFQVFAFFHCKLDPVVEDEDVKAKGAGHGGAAVQLVAYLGYAVLLDDLLQNGRKLLHILSEHLVRFYCNLFLLEI